MNVTRVTCDLVIESIEIMSLS